MKYYKQYRDQLGNELWGCLAYPLMNQFDGLLWYRLWNKLMDQTGNKVGTRLRIQLKEEL